MPTQSPLSRRQVTALLLAPLAGCSRVSFNSAAIPRSPREGVPLGFFQNLDKADLESVSSRFLQLQSAPMAEREAFVQELNKRNCKLRLVDSSGKAVIQGNPGYCWPFQEALMWGMMASKSHGPDGRQLVRDPLVPATRVTLAPDGARTVQACLVTGTVLTKSPYRLIASYTEGLAVVDDPVSKMRGYINTEGKFQIAPRFAHGAFVFSEGLASVAEQAGKWGAIDKSGKFVLEPKYTELSAMADGWMTFRAADRRGIVNAAGKEVSIPGNPAQVRWLGDYALADGSHTLFLNDRTEPVLITKQGHIQPLNGIRQAFEMPTGFAARKADEKGFRWYDEHLKPIYDKPLRNMGAGVDGVAPVQETELWGLMGKDRKWRVAPRYSYLAGFSYGLAEFERDKKAGFVTAGGDEIVIPDMAAGDCYGHFLYVTHRSQVPGFYTREGKLIELANVLAR